MVIDPTPDRRTVLKTVGAAGVLGSINTASAEPPQQGVDDLRLFSEQPVGGATEVVTRGTLAYVATGTGLSIVDWANRNRPELVLDDMDVPGVAVWDVKVEGDLLAISSQGENERGDGGDPAAIGTHFYDVSDPSDPEFLGTWTELPAGAHNHFLDGDVAYVCREAPFDDSALKIVDVSDPTAPTLLSEWRVEDHHPELDGGAFFVHDVYVQDDLAYLAYWNAGARVLDVSDPENPVEVAGFGEAPNAPILAPPGNAHYVQPSPDGDHVYVGAETFVTSEPGPIDVWDLTDPDAPERVTTIEAPDLPKVFRTSHNFDVTANRLHTSWYDGGVRVYDVTDPSAPEELSAYRTDDTSFWTAVSARGFTVASDIGGGLLFLHDDRGAKSPPAFDGSRERGSGPGPEDHTRPD
ncbi:hypothetical protein BRC93_12695 [Halobacteriales archaeon QS_5_70_15]|nr:MAG: hypothetical protein BRC93_12695 [Halobacteriales archaeon QS_5_70_15]